MRSMVEFSEISVDISTINFPEIQISFDESVKHSRIQNGSNSVFKIEFLTGIQSVNILQGVGPQGASGNKPIKGVDYLTPEEVEDLQNEIFSNLPIFDGSFEITPLVRQETLLNTKAKYLDRDIVIREIPYAEVSNTSNGKTVTIGG